MPPAKDIMKRLRQLSISLLALGLLTLPAVPAGAQPAPAATSLDDILRSGLERGLPGVAVTVQRDGVDPILATAGLASLETRTPLSNSDRFAFYSITKTFVATVVLQLVDEGVLTLDDTVAQRLDDPAAMRIPNVDQITLRQLLNHTGGVYDYADDQGPFQPVAFGEPANWGKVWTPQELLGYADGATYAPYSAPGQLAHYSNTDYILLGLVIQQATGNRLADEIRARILVPLDLNQTYLAVDEEVPGGYVPGYHVLGGNLVNVSALNTSWAWAAGGMVSTPADVARFGQAVFTGELLSPSSFEEMFTFAPSIRPHIQQGLGVYRIGSPNGELVGMDGQGAGYVSSMMRLPSEGVTVVVLANMAPDAGATDTIRDESIAWSIAQTALAELP
jgi:D-alanyl-D-alanine carboxypeptidase